MGGRNPDRAGEHGSIAQSRGALVRYRADGASVSSQPGADSGMKNIFAVLILLTLAGCAARPQATVVPPTATTVPIPPPPPKGEPDLFKGIPASQLRTLVGTPAFTRKDGATEMWRYDTAPCHVFFF